MSLDRNPSPPPEILKKHGDFAPDRIGNTVYSKRGLYKILMKMLEVVKAPAVAEKTSDASSSENEQPDESSQNIMELDPKVEDDACTLWDMSANSEVSNFLCECNVAEIFLTIIEQTRSPRLLEIVVGILGNMSSFESCEYISKNKALVCSIIALSGCSDSCTLLQLFRLLGCCLANQACQKYWIDEFEENPHFMENLRNILQNNLCHNILLALFKFLDRLFICDSSSISLWSQEQYVLSVVAAGNQFSKSNDEDFEDALFSVPEVFFSVLNAFCQNSFGLSAFAKHFDQLRPLFHTFFLEIGGNLTLPSVKKFPLFSETFGSYGNMLYSESINLQEVKFETGVFKSMLKIAKSLERFLLTNPSKEDYEGYKSECKKTFANGESVPVVRGFHVISEFLIAVIFAAEACCTHVVDKDDLLILEEIKSLEAALN